MAEEQEERQHIPLASLSFENYYNSVKTLKFQKPIDT